MDTLKTFSDRLSSVLRERNITQKELANAIGVQPATISTYLRKENQKTPNITMTSAIAKYLNVSIDWLCGLDNEKQDKTVVSLSELFKQFIDIMTIFDAEIGRVAMDNAEIHYHYELLSAFLTQYDALLLLRANKTLSEDLYSVALQGLLQKYNDITFDYKTYKFSDDDLPF